MTTIWPWLTVAGLGALHGLSPTNGWMFAAACGVQAREAGAARRALLPIGIGHAASVVVVALAVAGGMRFDMEAWRQLAGATLLALATTRVLPAKPFRPRFAAEASTAGMALWSFLISSAQGSGLMLVPALVPMCLATSPAREITASGSVLMALGAVLVHAGAMLTTTAMLALCGYRAASGRLGRVDGNITSFAWTAMLITMGIVLVGTGSAQG